MFEVNGELLTLYQGYVVSSVSSFMVLWATIIGVFLAFAIANMLRHFILKIAK